MTAAPAGESKSAEENAPVASTPDVDDHSQLEEKLPEPVGPNEPVEEGKVEVATKAKTDKEKATADPSGNVVTQRKTAARTKVKNDPFDDVDMDKLPVAIAIGQVTVSIEEYAGRAVASFSLRGWVGDAPLKLLASDIGEFEQALAELRKQLS